jgi:vacuolar-type H+-ATPase subunit H
MTTTKTAKTAAKKFEKSAKVKIAQAKQTLTTTVGHAQASAAKALQAADTKGKALTAPFVKKLDSAWKRAKSAMK